MANKNRKDEQARAAAATEESQAQGGGVVAGGGDAPSSTPSGEEEGASCTDAPPAPQNDGTGADGSDTHSQGGDSRSSGTGESEVDGETSTSPSLTKQIVTEENQKIAEDLAAIAAGEAEQRQADARRQLEAFDEEIAGLEDGSFDVPEGFQGEYTREQYLGIVREQRAALIAEFGTAVDPKRVEAFRHDQSDLALLAHIDQQLELLRGPDGEKQVPEGKTLEAFIAEGEQVRAEVLARIAAAEQAAGGNGPSSSVLEFERGELVNANGRGIRVVRADEQYVYGLTPQSKPVRVPREQVTR